MSSFELVIATTNPHKLRELRALLAVIPIEVRSLRDFPNYTPAPEKGETFQEIAHNKAFHAAQALQKWVLADDSGITVPKLRGEPGIYSRVYAGPEASDKENRKKLLESMCGFQGLDRSATFHCALAIADPSRVQKVVCGVCEGVVTEKEQGGFGFGYDPIFCEFSYQKTYAQLSEEIKLRISHRRKAFDKIFSFLTRIVHEMAG